MEEDDGKVETEGNAYCPGRGGKSSNVVVAGSNSSASHVRSAAISFNDMVPAKTHTIIRALEFQKRRFRVRTSQDQDNLASSMVR